MLDIHAYQDYQKERLSTLDLDDYSNKVNECNEDLNIALENYLAAKQEYHKKKLTKQEYLLLKKEYHEQEEKLKLVLKTDAFKNNFKNVDVLFKGMLIGDEHYEEIKKDHLDAKKLYQEFKEVVRSRGRFGRLEKLNKKALEVKNLNFRYSESEPNVLDDVSFTIDHGEYVAIVGQNGSGKSTLSKIIIGVLQADSGSVKVFGNLMTSQNVEKIRQFLGIVFQNPDNQFIGSTVKDDIAFGLENKRIDPKAMQPIIDAAATRVGMQDFLNKEPLMLSGGQKQRVAIASTLALNPDIIIFDEATSMLDPKGKREIKEIMVDLKNEGSKTILSITHDMDEILNASKVLVMNNGKLIRYGDPKEVMQDKNFLRQNGLELPFLGMVEDALETVGVEIKHGAINLDELVDNICKVN